MDKKIISIFLLLIIFVSIAVTYSYFNQSITKEKQYDGSIETIDEEVSYHLFLFFLKISKIF